MKKTDQHGKDELSRGLREQQQTLLTQADTDKYPHALSKEIVLMINRRESIRNIETRLKNEMDRALQALRNELERGHSNALTAALENQRHALLTEAATDKVIIVQS